MRGGAESLDIQRRRSHWIMSDFFKVMTNAAHHNDRTILKFPRRDWQEPFIESPAGIKNNCRVYSLALHHIAKIARCKSSARGEEVAWGVLASCLMCLSKPWTRLITCRLRLLLHLFTSICSHELEESKQAVRVRFIPTPNFFQQDCCLDVSSHPSS